MAALGAVDRCRFVWTPNSPDWLRKVGQSAIHAFDASAPSGGSLKSENTCSGSLRVAKYGKHTT